MWFWNALYFAIIAVIVGIGVVIVTAPVLFFIWVTIQWVRDLLIGRGRTFH